MKLIIAGPRDLDVSDTVISLSILCPLLDSDFEQITEIVHGACKTGVDACADKWAGSKGIARQPFPAPWSHWRELGLKSRHEAGPYRNRKMAEYADALMVIKRKGVETKGTSSMMREGGRAGIPIYVKEI